MFTCLCSDSKDVWT